MSTTSYTVSARYYDAAYTSKQDLTDLPFYLDLAQQSGGPVLELGCGTGRIALPIARAGIKICGVDQATPMLDVLRAKCAGEKDAVQQRLEIVQGDLRQLRLERQFPLVIIPFRVLQHMYTLDQQLAALNTARAHLTPNGRLVFDLFFPKFDRVFTGLGQEYLDLEWQEGIRTVRRFFCKDACDPVHLNFTGRFIFRLYENDQLVSQEEEQLKMCFYTYPHLQLLFRTIGLEVAEEYGDFDRRPLSGDGPQMIFVLKKSA